MITREKYEELKLKTLEMFDKACIVLSSDEKEQIEIADFGLNNINQFGLELITYINTDRVCAKELVLFPWQTCPEHYHPPVEGEEGKEETFRCRWGEVYIFVPGDPTPDPLGKISPNSENKFTVFHEIILKPGDQYTLLPGTRHWFQAGPDGAIVSEFSTTSRDESDIFTDTRIVRAPVVE
jgi:D-lyxose ketol-isomerase